MLPNSEHAFRTLADGPLIIKFQRVAVTGSRIPDAGAAVSEGACGHWVLGFGPWASFDRRPRGGPRDLASAMPMVRCRAALLMCLSLRPQSLRTSGNASTSTRPWTP
eukprot:1254664-Alexandrium_andersonii.AAC.1